MLFCGQVKLTFVLHHFHNAREPLFQIGDLLVNFIFITDNMYYSLHFIYAPPCCESFLLIALVFSSQYLHIGPDFIFYSKQLSVFQKFPIVGLCLEIILDCLRVFILPLYDSVSSDKLHYIWSNCAKPVHSLSFAQHHI